MFRREQYIHECKKYTAFRNFSLMFSLRPPLKGLKIIFEYSSPIFCHASARWLGMRLRDRPIVAQPSQDQVSILVHCCGSDRLSKLAFPSVSSIAIFAIEVLVSQDALLPAYFSTLTATSYSSVNATGRVHDVGSSRFNQLQLLVGVEVVPQPLHHVPTPHRCEE